ncbi:MAG: winged helix-turn-helix transcriptional regulator [Eubacteriaceae bacterium]|nr:winged helix-turn-helix transcriptional regulator [Eubacteriaceae bacterium]MBQ1465586.1 winged helix-turn-helix transcriptional regulator [Eubacteriaceae bacterium]MBR2780806.1 winged helix-turn-helix transcriptional regulator [Eubacteriaceae bacterium]MCR4894217.1 metalloregulator ArsR/SmtB family transcription factor [Eubacteriales bacterium]
MTEHLPEECICIESAVCRQMPCAVKLGELADFFKNLSDPTRLSILCMLTHGDKCVCDIADALGATQSSISHQLRILKQSKLVKSTRDGKSVIYSLQDGHVREVMETGLAHLGESL